jgi:TRAP-type C4-dicarboxylate transport system permease small subunit
MSVRWLVRGIEWLIALGMGGIVAIVILEVVFRYAVRFSLIVTEELTRYLMIWVAFLASALALQERSHIALTGLAERPSRGGRRLVRGLSHLLVLGFLVILTVEGIRILPKQLDQYLTTVNVSIFWFYLAIPTGAILMIVFTVRHAWRDVRHLFRRAPAPER